MDWTNAYIWIWVNVLSSVTVNSCACVCAPKQPNDISIGRMDGMDGMGCGVSVLRTLHSFALIWSNWQHFKWFFLFISGEWVETSSTAATASAPAIVKKKYHSLNWSFDNNSQAINKYTYSCRLDWLAICKYATGHCDIVNWMRLYFQIGIYWVNEFYGRHHSQFSS